MAKLYVFVENEKNRRALMETLGNWGYRWGDGNSPSDIPEPQIFTLYGREKNLSVLNRGETWREVVLFKEESLSGRIPYWGTERSVAKFLWSVFEDVPMDPETECIELPWLHFEAGTPREDIWHWFEDMFNVSVAEDLMGMRGESNMDLNFYVDEDEFGRRLAEELAKKCAADDTILKKFKEELRNQARLFVEANREEIIRQVVDKTTKELLKKSVANFLDGFELVRKEPS